MPGNEEKRYVGSLSQHAELRYGGRYGGGTSSPRDGRQETGVASPGDRRYGQCTTSRQVEDAASWLSDRCSDAPGAIGKSSLVVNGDTC